MTANTTAIEDLLRQGVHDKTYPGAVWAIGNTSGTQASGAVGVLDPDHPEQPMQLDTVFDVASLTKILAVWSSIGALWEDDVLALDQPLGTLWPDVADHPLGQATARNLLTHTAGVPLRANLKNLYGTDRQNIRNGVLHESLHRPPGEAVAYTDRAALILGYLAEHLSGLRLDQLATQWTWEPLGMTGTCFGPLPAHIAANCAPTEPDQDTGIPLKGTAHDFSARLLGGVSGISGAFSILDDLTRFLRYMLEASDSPAAARFGPRWIQESLTIHTGNLEPPRGLFWHPAPGSNLDDEAWVHYGFTGTGMWIAPRQRRWAVLLTNKIRLTRERQPLTDIRNAFRTFASI
jgi:CubicO group peptidase (beta-lactamase class C family)